ncbi:hypothetical protein [Methanoregula sp.]|uniref:hypothetical protein n=1 Tax=Methanoregula sp. TaxID=2052170 RepID=UPI002CF9DBBB|nr:hypothetical protein [Methanoregula sp.]HVP96525.1 hypothetical protein [Methanoregula sp.]
MMMPGNGGNGQNTGSGNGQGSGNGAAPGGAPENGQNPGNGPDSFAGNATAHQGPQDRNFGNASWNATPPGPGGDLNLTALGNTLFGQLPPDVNTTESNNWTMPFNTTGPQPGGQNVPLPAGNQTGPNPAGGNVTPRSPPALSGNGNANSGGNQMGTNTAPAGGPQTTQQAGSASQDQKDSDLIAAFLSWLRSGGSSSS